MLKPESGLKFPPNCPTSEARKPNGVGRTGYLMQKGNVRPLIQKLLRISRCHSSKPRPFGLRASLTEPVSCLGSQPRCQLRTLEQVCHSGEREGAHVLLVAAVKERMTEGLNTKMILSRSSLQLSVMKGLPWVSETPAKSGGVTLHNSLCQEAQHIPC